MPQLPQPASSGNTTNKKNGSTKDTTANLSKNTQRKEILIPIRFPGSFTKNAYDSHDKEYRVQFPRAVCDVQFPPGDFFSKAHGYSRTTIRNMPCTNIKEITHNYENGVVEVYTVLKGKFLNNRILTGDEITMTCTGGSGYQLKSFNGAVRDNKPHGPGRCECFNGDITKGVFKSGKLHGGSKDGKLLAESKDVTQCSYLNQAAQLKYVGKFVDGVFVGGTRICLRAEEVYSGDFAGLRVDDTLTVISFHGQGSITYGRDKNGKSTVGNYKFYDGMWEQSRFHGKGTLITDDGSTYTGRFQDDFFVNGSCKFGRDKNGKSMALNYKSYNGVWEQGKFHGQGTLITDDGSTYTGHFNHGFFKNGTKRCENGDEFKGDFIALRLHCGKLTTAERHVYKGDFKDNKLHGEGTFTRPEKNGETRKYKGQFDSGARHGEGEEWIVDKSGVENPYFKGMYYCGKKKNGKLIWGDGDIYTGDFNEEGEMHGEGRYEVLEDCERKDEIMEGTFKNDKFFEGIITEKTATGTQEFYYNREKKPTREPRYEEKQSMKRQKKE